MYTKITRWAAIALAAALFTNLAAAESIILSPAAVPLKGRIGQSSSQVLTLNNDTNTELAFDLEVQDVVVQDGKRVFHEAGKVPGSIAATAVVNPRRIVVAPHTSATANVMFTLPEGMQHRAVVALFRGRTQVTSGARSATLSLGTLFTFTVGEELRVGGALQVEPAEGARNASIVARLSNVGTEPVVPAGTVVFVTDAGRLVAKAQFNSRRLLPGEAAGLSADYPDELDPGDYRAIATFDLGGKPFTLTSKFRVP